MTNQFIFFPFTHITQNQLRTLLTFFPSFQYIPVSADLKDHQTVEKLAEQGKIDPLFPSAKALVSVEQTVKQYFEWAQIHRGNKVNLKLLLKDNPYFTSDTNVAAIRSQIKGIKDEKAAPLDSPPDLHHDLLFLKMAQLCDEQNERIDLELRDLEKNRETLMSALRGLENPLSAAQGSKTFDTKDPGTMMTQERIRAWSGCLAQNKRAKQDRNSPLFITTSPAVFDYLESNCKDAVNALDIDKIKVHENECENKDEWHHRFCDGLMGAIQGNGNRENVLPQVKDGCSLSGQIKLYLFSGNTINKLFKMSDKQISVCLIKLK